MTKTIEYPRRYVVLDSDRARYERFLGNIVRVCTTRAEIANVYEENPEDLTWVSYTRRFLDDLLRTVARRRAERQRFPLRRVECVLTVASPRAESVPALHGLFAHIVGDSPGYRWLPKDELSEVLFDPATDRSQHFIAAASDPVTRTVSLVRGDCQQLVLPFSFFAPSGDETAPDFSKVRVTDFGRTVAFGPYEASADAILYEADTEYRKRTNQQRKESEKTFGAALFRLRKQKKLKRSDFSPLAAKTVARIERNEIGKPHGKTLQILGERLGVSPDEIESY
jgi:hypothetical protein